MTVAVETVEVRAYDDTGLQLRADTDSGRRVLIGRAVPFHKVALVANRFTEEFAPSCFRKSTAEAAKRLPLLVAHEHAALPIGSAVEWEERADDGLWAQWDLADTDKAREVHNLARDGHLRSLSVGFLPLPGGSDWTLKDPPEFDHVVRREARMLEVSVVGVGTYEDAEIVLVRTAEGRSKGRPRFEQWQKWMEQVKA